MELVEVEVEVDELEAALKVELVEVEVDPVDEEQHHVAPVRPRTIWQGNMATRQHEWEHGNMAT